MEPGIDSPLFCPVCRRHYDVERTVCPKDGAPLVEVPLTKPRPGNVFDGRYVLLDTVGKGGMATIYRGYDAPHRRQVALKVLKGRFSAEERAVTQFFAEARVARRLDHPNIVRIHDYGRTEVGYLYIAMELLRGETLARIIRSGGALEKGRALALFAQVVAALGAAHERGCVHRDLKPENIFVCRHDGVETVKLLDFGIAQFAGGPPSSPRDICGTPAYMSPEQIRGKKVGAASDLYSAGVVLFEMLTGRQPFTGASAMDILKKHLKTPPPSLSDLAPQQGLDERAEALVGRLLKKSTRERAANASDVCRELKEMLGESGKTEPRPQAESGPAEDSLADGTQPIFSFNCQAASGENPDAPLLLAVTSPDAEGYLAEHVRPRIRLEEQLSIRFDPAGAGDAGQPDSSNPAGPSAERLETESASPEPLSGEPPEPDSWVEPATFPAAAPASEIVRQAETYTLLHVRFVSLDSGSPADDDAKAEELRREIAADLECWFERVDELGGLVCYDSGAELKVLFGYLTQDKDFTTAALEAARSLSLQMELQVIRQGRRCGVKLGVATGLVYSDQNVEGPLEWMIRGSEVDFAARLSRVAPVGGVLLCENTALRCQPLASLHEIAPMVTRGGRSVATYLLRNLAPFPRPDPTDRRLPPGLLLVGVNDPEAPGAGPIDI
jgi:serine/threonine protein kinase/class 3 adenylate cyclase